MARIRYLKPDFFKDEDLALLPFETRLFYQGLWCQADKAGRLQDRPSRLKVEIFPYDDVDVEKCLEDLSKCKDGSGQPFINRYVTDGQRYIEILTWDEHQKPHHTEKPSRIPPAPPYGKGNGKGNGKAAQSEYEVKQPLNNGEVTVKGEVKTYTQKDFVDAGILVGLTESEAVVCFEYYKSLRFCYQGKAEQPVLSAQDACKRFRNNRHIFQGKGSENDTRTRLFPIAGKGCGAKGCHMPAVHKVSGDYDNYYCWQHIPLKIREGLEKKYRV